MVECEPISVLGIIFNQSEKITTALVNCHIRHNQQNSISPQKVNIKDKNNLPAADMQQCSHLNSWDRSEQGRSDHSQVDRSDHYTIYNPAGSALLLK